MQIILLEKVANLGNLGDVVKVKDGYARNFLIPTGQARRATDAAVKEFEARRAELEKVQAEKLAAAQALGEKLNGKTVSLTQKAGVDGRLFGSVTNHDVADALKAAGFDVAKQQVRMPNGPLKTTGEHAVTVSLHTDVAGHSERHNGVANLTVSPAVLRWAVSDRSYAVAGLDIALSNGSYNPTRPSVSTGYTSFQPVLGFRHNDPNGLDVGVINRLLINRENSTTHYRSGRGYVGEFTAGWNTGPWKMGVVGSYLNQFSDDQQAGNTIQGNRARSFALGPSLNYNAGRYSVSLNYQRGVYATNTTKNNILGVGVTIPLWVKH